MGLPQFEETPLQCHRRLEDFLKNEPASAVSHDKHARYSVPVPKNYSFPSFPSPEQKQHRTQAVTKQEKEESVNDEEDKNSQQASLRKVVQRLQKLQEKQAEQAMSRDSNSRESIKEQLREANSLEGQKSFVKRLQLNASATQEEHEQSIRSEQSKQGIQKQQDISGNQVAIVVLKTLPGHGRSLDLKREKNAAAAAAAAGFLKNAKQGQQKTKRASIMAKPVISSRISEAVAIATAAATGKRNALTDCRGKLYASFDSSLMRPTVASSARRQQRIVVAPVAPAPDDPRPKALSNIKKSPRRRDQSESRAALLSLKNSFAASSSSSSADSKKNKKKNRKVAVQTENVGKKTSDEGRNPEEQIQQISVMPDQISKALPELFENLSPVSVLDVLYKDDDDSVSSRSSADQVARVELDKTFASSTTAVGLNSHRQAASGRLIKLRLFNAYCQDEEDCVEHWSKQQLECGRCKSQICQQIEAAIFDDLIYEAIIQLKAQRIKNSV